MTRQEVLERLCLLQEEVSGAIETAEGYRHPADCFCFQGGFWDSPSYGEDKYQNDGAALEWIERAVRKAIADLAECRAEHGA